MIGFEPRTSGIGSNRSTNYATATAPLLSFIVKFVLYFWLWYFLFQKTKNKQKQAGFGPFKKINVLANFFSLHPKIWVEIHLEST